MGLRENSRQPPACHECGSSANMEARALSPQEAAAPYGPAFVRCIEPGAAGPRSGQFTSVSLHRGWRHSSKRSLHAKAATGRAQSDGQGWGACRNCGQLPEPCREARVAF